MIRKLAMAMVVSGALGSSYANALGLGEIKLNSALNQPLDAEVKLLNVGDLSKNEILPNLASHEDFARAGVERVFFLTSIKFDVELDGKGGATLHLTTDRIVREPFLNFLIELHWPSGRLLREYTALLDPPLFSEAPPAPVQQAVATPVFEQPAPQPTPVPAYSTPTRDTAPAQATVQSQPTPPGKKEGTVRVKKNDTLWSIAEENRPDRSVTVRQTMLAIQEENPHAFINNNINLLKSGQVLRIPEVEEIRRISSQQAYSEIARQNEAWSSKKTIDATQTYEERESGAAATGEQGGMVKLLASEGEGVAEDNQSVSASGVGAESDSGIEGPLSGSDELAGEEGSVANVDALEKELEDLQRLVTLKQQELAILQSSLAEQETEAGAAAEEAAAGSVEPDASPLSEVAELEPVEENVEEAIAVAESGEAAETPAVDEAAPDAVAQAVDSEAAAVAQMDSAKAQEKRPEQGVLDILLNNPLYIGILLVVLLGALIMLGAISRRRKEEQAFAAEPVGAAADSFDEEIEIPEDLDEVLADAEEPSAAVQDVADSVPETPVQEPGDDTRKLLEEADIYIAYGRYERATEILQPAVNDRPDNTALRLKLAEIFLASNEHSRFEQQEMDLQAIGDADALASLESLKEKYGAFSSEPEALIDEAAAVLESGEEAVDELDELEFELPGDDQPLESIEEETVVSDDNLVEFDMASDQVDEEDFLDVDADVAEQLDDNIVEFNLDEGAAVNSGEVSSADDMDFLVDTDESATKLELAKAYIDMADTEAAQDILNEVMTEGSEPQKEEARKLLENLE